MRSQAIVNLCDDIRTWSFVILWFIGHQRFCSRTMYNEKENTDFKKKIKMIF